MKQKEINKVEIRNLQKEDYDQLASSFTRVYADGSDVFWTPEQIDKLIRIFPEGQIVTVVDDKIVGCALSIIVNYNDVKKEDIAWVTRCALFDDRRAFACLVDKYQVRLKRFFLNLTGGDPVLSDDLAQETFIKVYYNLRSYKGLSSFST